MGKKLTLADEAAAIQMYQDELLACGAISERLGVSRQAVWKLLKRNGVNTQKGIATQREAVCEFCGKAFQRTRARIRDQVHHFCCDDCYFSWLDRNDYQADRWGQMVARKAVEDIYGPLPDGSVVHHCNGNCSDNALANLMLFASQSDHVKWHREVGGVVPLWTGQKAEEESPCT